MKQRYAIEWAKDSYGEFLTDKKNAIQNNIHDLRIKQCMWIWNTLSKYTDITYDYILKGNP